MKAPYFESVRIAMDETTKEEFEMPTVMLFSSIERIEKPDVKDDVFKNQHPKTVVKLHSGTLVWLLVEYALLRTLWLEWLDAASNIQSVFTNN